MRVLVYVEGPSDRDALPKLLRDVYAEARSARVAIKLLAEGDKARVLRAGPRKAALHLRENPRDWVFVLPDLYPMSAYAGTDNAHASFEELDALLRHRFAVEADQVGLPTAVRHHFRAHCLKHDLEALLLAAPDVLKKRLGTDDKIEKGWQQPVEDQNDDKPPKYVVTELFKKYKQKGRYTDTIDAPWILERAQLDVVMAACPQRFAPFVRELRVLASGGELGA
ncbi:MAG: DUF4276 family protein [Deltaproteobacteria bacterium]|nr:DUF4276 family protein [Deltaproteobacteria bacterium]